MSTARSCRYLLAAGVAFVGIGMLIEGVAVTGVLCLITAVLLLPILYQVLLIGSNEVQVLSPLIFLVVTLFSFAMYTTVPEPHRVPLKVVYSTSVSEASTEDTVTTERTTQTTSVPATTYAAGSTVYRTPEGKRYHYNPTCGGENSYEVSLENAEAAGLTPCKKCAGG